MFKITETENQNCANCGSNLQTEAAAAHDFVNMLNRRVIDQTTTLWTYFVLRNGHWQQVLAVPLFTPEELLKLLNIMGLTYGAEGNVFAASMASGQVYERGSLLEIQSWQHINWEDTYFLEDDQGPRSLEVFISE